MPEKKKKKRKTKPRFNNIQILIHITIIFLSISKRARVTTYVLTCIPFRSREIARKKHEETPKFKHELKHDKLVASSNKKETKKQTDSSLTEGLHSI